VLLSKHPHTQASTEDSCMFFNRVWYYAHNMITNTEHKLFCCVCGAKRLLLKCRKNKWIFKNGDIKYTQYYSCRDCNTKRLKKYRATPEGAKRTREAVYRSIKKHPEKQKARLALNYALKNGVLNKPKCCMNCKKRNKLEAHHHDYGMPLTVVWLCRPCHTIV